MDVVITAVIGALAGVFMAKKRGGNRLDMAQYAAVFAILFAVGGLILSILFTRLFVG